MAVTIKDIAKYVGVSHSTVSRALNGSSEVNFETKEKILKAAKELNYIPDINARSLKLSKPYNIGVFFSTIDKGTSAFVFHNVITNVYEGIGSRYNVIVKGIDTYEKNSINPKNYDGILVVSQKEEDDEFIEEILSKNIPLVVINREVNYDVINVFADERIATRRGFEELLYNGHRKIGIIEGKEQFLSTKLRREGCLDALKKYNTEIDKDLVVSGDFTVTGGYFAAKKIIDKEITAIFAFNDEMAIGAIKAIRESGLRVPEDISILGFDGTEIGEYLTPSIATIKRPVGKVSKLAINLLMKKINGEEINEKKVGLESEIVFGDSIRKLC
ncbi:MAG: LacI family transcriptional regulator [Clostridium sp.]|uniref:LacI family DNA-binding transcriptional regulator n=1 Tax=Clostridium sp. DSM 8431 TaxID=1761781 RepID=UPI0008EDFEEF|nr:LacI family DNA-binding transcriptional regulator [Clostridium sp. DSM 8431]MCR4944365.1 LacI family transcriptional regulator [Clostridium sp.]SFU51836.1 transcriptional regulator, LacI family [Clostridium sp. DSM 8431]